MVGVVLEAEVVPATEVVLAVEVVPAVGGGGGMRECEGVRMRKNLKVGVRKSM